MNFRFAVGGVESDVFPTLVAGTPSGGQSADWWCRTARRTNSGRLGRRSMETRVSTWATCLWSGRLLFCVFSRARFASHAAALVGPPQGGDGVEVAGPCRLGPSGPALPGSGPGTSGVEARVPTPVLRGKSGVPRGRDSFLKCKELGC